MFKLTKAKTFFWLGVLFLGGIFLSQFFAFNLIIKLAFLDCAFILIFVWYRYKICLFVGFGILVFLLGIFRYGIALPIVDNNWVQYYNEKEEIEIMGSVVSEPDIRMQNTRLTIGNLKLKGNEKFLKGKILVTVPKYPNFYYGDLALISAKLKDPGEFNEFNYRDFLGKSGIYSLVYNPKIELISNGHGNYLFSFVLKIKEKFRASIMNILPEPQSSLIDGLLLGNKSGLSNELLDKFNLVGVSHVIVVSGYHVTVICSILLSLGMLFLSRKQSFLLAVVGLLLFILLTGVQSSAIRASIMGGLVLVALNSGRMSNIRNVLLFSALIIILFNPLLLSFDVGFQLSFLATIGIVYFTPIILKYLKFFPNIFKLREILGMTFAAQILVLPIIMNNFERFSVISPLVNLLILPFVPLMMLLGFLGGFFGLFVLSVGKIFGLLAWLLVSYMIGIVEFFAKFEFASIEVNKFWFGWTVLYYVVILVVWRLLKKKRA